MSIWKRSREEGTSSLAEGKSFLSPKNQAWLTTDPLSQASADAPTDSELLALAAEEDGTMEGDSKAEEKRLKEEKWAQYADENRKGSGNTMNRG